MVCHRACVEIGDSGSTTVQAYMRRTTATVAMTSTGIASTQRAAGVAEFDMVRWMRRLGRWHSPAAVEPLSDICLPARPALVGEQL